MKVNCLHAKCPSCGADIDVVPVDGSIIEPFENFEELVLSFLKTERMRPEWDAFCDLNGVKNMLYKQNGDFD